MTVIKKIHTKSLKHFAGSKFFISLCLIAFILVAMVQGQSIGGLFSDFIQRVGMNGILVLSMVPAVVCGTGLNFGLSIGILCGLFGGCLSIELNITGIAGFSVAVFIGLALGALFGTLYGMLLNKIKGNEMTAGTYVGFSAVALMSIGWSVIPFKSNDMVWAIGGTGLRTTISLTDKFANILDEFLTVNYQGYKLNLGTLLFFVAVCLILSFFGRTKAGFIMKASGENPKFAKTMGVNTDKQRIIGTVISTMLGALGIIVYSQSFGFMQLYQAPLMMPFSAVAAVLVGGATVKKCTVSNAVWGVILFQLLMSVSVPVINKLMPDTGLTEAVRIIISYGVILYALTLKGGQEVEY